MAGFAVLVESFCFYFSHAGQTCVPCALARGATLSQAKRGGNVSGARTLHYYYQQYDGDCFALDGNAATLRAKSKVLLSEISDGKSRKFHVAYT